jgi:phosphoglycolate phosphatase-like HAD superfamily hydrolase
MTASVCDDSVEQPVALIWDIDGTLADSWKLGFDATLEVLEQNNIPTITEEVYHYHTRYSTPDRMARHAGLEPGDPNYESVGEKLGAQFDNLYVGLVSTKTAGFYPGIDELLMDVPDGVGLGALTNACVAYADAVFRVNSVPGDEKRQYSERFQSIRGADNVPKPKPNPDGLLAVCKDLAVDPSRCVYIGDSPSDAMAAHNAGMRSIGVLWGSHPKASLLKAPFSVLCETIDDLREVLCLVTVN